MEDQPLRTNATANHLRREHLTAVTIVGSQEIHVGEGRTLKSAGYNPAGAVPAGVAVVVRQSVHVDKSPKLGATVDA